MSSVTQTYGANTAFIEDLYERYRANPESVSTSWREFFRDPRPEGVDIVGLPAGRHGNWHDCVHT